MSALWLLRHAAVVAEAGLCYGRTDLACTAGSTRGAAEAIAPSLPVDISVRTSPLRRCAELADAIGSLRPDLRIAELDARLAEMNFGDWEGRPWAAIDPAELEAWTSDFVDFRVGGDGETTRFFMRRVQSAWEDWRASGRDALWVTHAGVMRAVLLLRDGVACPVTAAQWPRRVIGHGAWMRLEG
ncbi:MAG: histidine phosphatase family protein [Janthinobacterium lividum]